jgi:uncharacterized protein (DUF2384 family)
MQLDRHGLKYYSATWLNSSGQVAEKPMNQSIAPASPLPESANNAAIKAMSRLFQAWSLRGVDAAMLAGVSQRTWARMKVGSWSGSLTQDQLLRASALIGLYKGLHLYFDDALADKWIKMPNRGPLFRGQTPVSFMESGGLPAIMQVRAYIDAVRGGV